MMESLIKVYLEKKIQYAQTFNKERSTFKKYLHYFLNIFFCSSTTKIRFRKFLRNTSNHHST